VRGNRILWLHEWIGSSLNAVGPDHIFFIEDAFALIADESRFDSTVDKIKVHNAAELEKYRTTVAKN